jgi:hypothetical protein
MKKIRNYIVWLLAIVLVGGVTGTVLAAGGGGVVTADPTKHFDSKGKMPSEFTIEL